MNDPCAYDENRWTEIKKMINLITSRHLCNVSRKTIRIRINWIWDEKSNREGDNWWWCVAFSFFYERRKKKDWIFSSRLATWMMIEIRRKAIMWHIRLTNSIVFLGKYWQFNDDFLFISSSSCIYAQIGAVFCVKKVRLSHRSFLSTCVVVGAKHCCIRAKLRRNVHRETERIFLLSDRRRNFLKRREEEWSENEEQPTPAIECLSLITAKEV